MSKHELIQAYVTGRIARRDFVRRLTALGVSGAAAAAYAHSLTPAAAASGLTRDAKGLIVRLQASDPYGELPIDEIIDILRSFLEVFEQIFSLLDQLFSQFGIAPSEARQFGYRAVALQTGELSESDLAELDTLRTQIGLQRDALRTAISDFGGNSSAASSTTGDITGDTSEAALTKLALLINAMVGVFAGVIPAIPGSGEQVVALRRTLTSVAFVQARHASFLNKLIGEPSFPDTFELALTRDDLARSIEAAAE